jgi:site-specific DNA-methyltransferase (adenine-specific)
VAEGQNTGIDNDQMESGAFLAFLTNAFTCARDVMKPGAPFYIWHAEAESVNFRTACARSQLPVRETLIWVKNHFVLGHLDYHYRHEPCLYGWKEGNAHYFTMSRSESSVIQDLHEIDPDKMKKDELVDLVKRMLSDTTPTTVIEMDKPTRSGEHPTMKPVALFDYLIRNSSKKGGIVLDSFAGSGTTIMACEQDGRKARCMELDPRYCDVIIQRWEEFTGREAVKING